MWDTIKAFGTALQLSPGSGRTAAWPWPSAAVSSIQATHLSMSLCFQDICILVLAFNPNPQKGSSTKRQTTGLAFFLYPLIYFDSLLQPYSLWGMPGSFPLRTTPSVVLPGCQLISSFCSYQERYVILIWGWGKLRPRKIDVS